jgi:hypothetical protein
MTTTTYEKAIIHRTAFGSALAGTMAARFYVQRESIWGVRGVTAGGTFYPELPETFQTLREAKAWIDKVLASPDLFINHRGAVTTDYRTNAGQPHNLPEAGKVRS